MALVIWENTTKELLCSMKHCIGNTYTFDKLISAYELNPNDYSSVEWGEFTSGQFRRMCYIDDNDIPQIKVKIPYAVDKTIIVANGTDEAVFSNLPNSTTLEVWINKEFVGSINVITGSDYITVDTSGVYKVIMQSKNYLDTEVLINAT